MYTFVKGEPNWVEPLNENFAEVAALAGAAVPASEKGAAGGVATLGSDGKLAQMPAANDIGVFNGFRPTSWTMAPRVVTDNKGFQDISFDFSTDKNFLASIASNPHRGGAPQYRASYVLLVCPVVDYLNNQLTVKVVLDILAAHNTAVINGRAPEVKLASGSADMPWSQWASNRKVTLSIPYMRGSEAADNSENWTVKVWSIE